MYVRIRRPIPAVFVAFLRYVNGATATVPAGILTDVSGRPLLRVAQLTRVQWAEARTRARELCCALALRGADVVDVNINARGGVYCRVFTGLATGRGLVTLVPHACNAHEAPYAMILAMRMYRVSQRQTVADRIGQCGHCRVLFFNKTRRPSKVCGLPCRRQQRDEQRRKGDRKGT